MTTTEPVSRFEVGAIRVTGPVGDDVREEIPRLGFRNYWYPACGASQVHRRRPKSLRLLGDDVCLFRTETGVSAIADLCPHRGARLSDGKCHFAGTVSCPYHGWTFDREGACVAALSEGPDSRPPTRSRVRAYPTVTLKGVVFIWMGDGPPTDYVDDLPPELTDDSHLLYDSTVWEANWRPALENLNDNHVFYVHRNSVQVLMRPIGKVSFEGAHAVISGGGVHLSSYEDGSTASRPLREYYPTLGGHWPRTHIRSVWTPLFATKPLAWLWRLGDDAAQYPNIARGYHNDPEWDMGPHMPGMQRINGGSCLYTRWCVPIDETSTREFYFLATRPSNAAAKLWETASYQLVQRLLRNRTLGFQDGKVLERLDFDAPERLTPYDLETVGWRRLAILSARHGGRHDQIPGELVSRINDSGRRRRPLS